MNETVLIVDDEANVRTALRRLLVDTELVVLEAGSGEEALKLLGSGDLAVVVADNRMPGMRGVEFLARAKARHPEATRILMTGYADLPTAIDAINHGEVFRFFLKPWKNEEFVEAVSGGVARYRAVRSLQAGDEATLRTIAQVIELKDPYTRGHCDRVASYSLAIGKALALGDAALGELKQGSWLHDCGKIGVPEAILNFPGPLGEPEMSVIRKHPNWGAEVARQAGLPRAVVDIVLYHHERWDGQGYSAGLSGNRIPLEARIVAVADTFDAMNSDRPYRKGMPAARALEILGRLAGTQLDPQLVPLFLGSRDAELAVRLAEEGAHA